MLNANAELALGVLPLDFQLAGLHAGLLDGIIALAAGKDGNAQAHAHVGVRGPAVFAELEVVRHGVETVGKAQAQAGNVGILLHAHGLGQLFGLHVQLTEGGVALQGGIGPFRYISEHGFCIVVQASHYVNFRFQLQAHHGLQLPQRQQDAAFCVVHVGNGSGHIALGAG